MLKKSKGKFIGNIKGFPCQRKPWCQQLKVGYGAKGNLSRPVLQSVSERFEAEDKGFIDPNARFHWADLDDMQTNIFQFFDKKGNYKGDYT